MSVKPRIEIVPDPEPGRRVWRCDACGRHGLWGDGWRWLGRYLVDHRRHRHHGGDEVIERVLCPACPNDREAPVL